MMNGGHVWNAIINSIVDVSNIESKWRRVEEENSKLKDQLSSTRETSRRNRERIEDDFENSESRLRKTENRLADSNREKERLAEQLEGIVSINIFERVKGLDPVSLR